jgi:hypothetical protein
MNHNIPKFRRCTFFSLSMKARLFLSPKSLEKIILLKELSGVFKRTNFLSVQSKFPASITAPPTAFPKPFIHLVKE